MCGTNTRDTTGLPSGDVSSGGIPIQSSGIQIPAGTYYRIRVNGRISVGSNATQVQQVCGGSHSYPAVGSYGPNGTGNIGQELQVLVETVDSTGHGTMLSFPGGYGTSGPDSVASALQYTSIPLTVSVGHAGLGGVCSYNGQSAGLYTMSGTQTVSVDELTELVRLTANPLNVKKGRTVTFQVTSPDLPSASISIFSWNWTSDPNQTGRGPRCYPVNPCTDTTFAAGTMQVDAWIGSFEFKPTVHISVYSQFTLDASKVLANIGDSVVFTPKLDGTPTTVGAWAWTSDTTVSDVTRCTASDATCKKMMLYSGTMTAYLGLPGQSDSAKVHVTVLKCPNSGNPVLDAPEVRLGFAQAMKASNPDSTPGSGIDPSHWATTGYRKEHGVWILKRPDGSYYTLPAVADTATECSFQLNSTTPAHDSLDVVVGTGHTHEGLPGDKTYGNCRGSNGAESAHYPGDPLRQPATLAADADGGGGSKGDWDTAFEGFDVYTMSYAGDFWRLPGGWSYSQRFDSTSTRHWSWKSSAPLACTWP